MTVINEILGAGEVALAEDRARLKVALIEDRAGFYGSTTARQLRLTCCGYLLLAVFGLWLAFQQQGFMAVFGLGLSFPGAGFLFYLGGDAGHIAIHALMFLASLVVFGLGFFLWFASGNILAPIVAWLGSAAIAASMHQHITAPIAPWIMVVLIPVGFAVMLLMKKRATDETRRNRERRNQYLREYNERNAESSSESKASSKKVSSKATGAETSYPELSPKAIGFYRYSLDRALQPVDEFNGFNRVDQFQTSAVRYQVCIMGYNLAAVQRGTTPAFRGYLSDAQVNLHKKMADHVNWGYWFWENAWGNLKLDPNPVGKDNIMYTGWLAAMMGEYMLNTGSREWYDTPLVLKHPKKGYEYRYTFNDLADNIYENFIKSAYCLYPCEPNWIYTMCNNYGAIALKLHDQMAGTNYWETITKDYRHHLEQDFMTPDGRAIGIRSSRTGLTIPALTSVMADSITVHYMAGLYPDIARRSWQIVRNDFLKIADGNIELTLRGWDKLDIGNYNPSLLTTYGNVGIAAAEMGDLEVTELIRDRVEREFEFVEQDGAIHIPGASTQALVQVQALYAHTPGVRRAMHEGPLTDEQLNGPIIKTASYPEVIVAMAHNEGDSLSMVLHPGGSSDSQQTIGLAQLKPGMRYKCSGAAVNSIVAGANGEAELGVRLQGRTPIKVFPDPQ